MAKSETNEFVTLLKDTRKRFGLSPDEFGEIMTVSPGYICGVEIGRIVPSEMFVKLFQCLFCTKSNTTEQVNEDYNKFEMLPNGIIKIDGLEIDHCLNVEISEIKIRDLITVKVTLTFTDIDIKYKPFDVNFGYERT